MHCATLKERMVLHKAAPFLKFTPVKALKALQEILRVESRRTIFGITTEWEGTAHVMFNRAWLQSTTYGRAYAEALLAYKPPVKHLPEKIKGDSMDKAIVALVDCTLRSRRWRVDAAYGERKYELLPDGIMCAVLLNTGIPASSISFIRRDIPYGAFVGGELVAMYKGKGTKGG